MAASKTTRKISRKTAAPRATALDASPRHLWLASLGLLVAARRESLTVAGRASAKVGDSIADARHAIRRAEADLRAGVDGVRDQVAPKMACFSNEVEARLAPIVSKLGLKKQAKRTRRKPAAKKKPATRRATRKPGMKKAVR